MPNPFEKQTPVEKSTGVTLNTIKITNSELTCENCWNVVTDGEYIPDARRLTFDCDVCGHQNVVRNFDL